MRALFRLACLAYPHDFRTRYFAQIVGDFEQHESEFSGGIAYLLRMLGDVFFSGLALRVELFTRDVMSALRRLRQAPLLVVIVVLTFALGIGANLTVFSVLNSVLLRPIPYPNADRLITIRIMNATGAQSFPDSFSLPDLSDFRTRSLTLQSVTGFTETSRTLTGYGKPAALRAMSATANFFSTLGVKPELGRFPDHPAPEQGPDPRVVISDALWRGRFHGAADIVGRTIVLDGVSSRIIGVAPPGFESPEPFYSGFQRSDIWTFLPDTGPQKMRGWRYLFAVALLKLGVSLDAARTDLSRVQQQLAQQYPHYDKDHTIIVDPLRTAVFKNSTTAVLWIIFAAVLGVFLIMCANVANLLLTQTNARTHELTMRMALGASRARVTHQLLVECGVLAVIGGIVGIAIAYGSLHEFVALAQGRIPRLAGATLDLPVLLYGIGIVFLATLFAGAAPAWILTSPSAMTSVRSASRSGVSANRRLQSSLVVVEIALALALVTASGLAIRSFYALTHADIGVRSAGLFVSNSLAFPSRRYPTDGSKIVVLNTLQEHLSRIPGSTYALAVSYPMSDDRITTGFNIAGRSHQIGHGPAATYDAVSPGYFRVFGIHLLRGREFSSGESANSQPVVIVNKAFSTYFPPGTPLVGQRVRVALQNVLHPDAWRTIVGVVSDTRDDPAGVAQPDIYFPLAQTTNDWITAAVYAPHSPANAVRGAMTKAFAAADPLSQPPTVRTMSEVMADSANSARLSAALFTALGIIALTLAIAGIFGVVSYSVSQRIAEFGIRMAIGSTPGAIVANVLRGVAILLAFGIGIGLVLAAIAGRTLSPQLYGVQALDMATLVAVTAILASTALIAAILPALRAARIDPAMALRYE